MKLSQNYLKTAWSNLFSKQNRYKRMYVQNKCSFFLSYTKDSQHSAQFRKKTELVHLDKYILEDAVSDCWISVKRQPLLEHPSEADGAQYTCCHQTDEHIWCFSPSQNIHPLNSIKNSFLFGIHCCRKKDLKVTCCCDDNAQWTDSRVMMLSLVLWWKCLLTQPLYSIISNIEM